MARPHRGEVRGRGEAISHRHADTLDSSHAAPQQQPTRQAKWRARNPLAAWAHSALRSALRRGLVQRLPCKVCGDKKSQGHHPNYNRPADVIWLCAKHHKEAHKEARNEQ